MQKCILYLFIGLAQFAISMATIGGLVYYGKFPYKYLTVNYLSLMTATTIFAFIVSIVVYALSRKASSKEPSGRFRYWVSKFNSLVLVMKSGIVINYFLI